MPTMTATELTNEERIERRKFRLSLMAAARSNDGNLALRAWDALSPRTRGKIQQERGAYGGYGADLPDVLSAAHEIVKAESLITEAEQAPQLIEQHRKELTRIEAELAKLRNQIEKCESRMLSDDANEADAIALHKAQRAVEPVDEKRVRTVNKIRALERTAKTGKRLGEGRLEKVRDRFPVLFTD